MKCSYFIERTNKRNAIFKNLELSTNVYNIKVIKKLCTAAMLFIVSFFLYNLV